MPRLAVLLVLTLLLAGCTSADPDPTPTTTGAAPHVELGFTQLLPDEGTRKGLLRVVNLSDLPLPVTEAGLSWSGYGDFTSPQDATIAPEHTLDLRVLLPVADCDAGDGPVVGVVRTADSAVEQPLTASGQVFVRRMWSAWCADRLVERNFAVRYAGDWRIAPVGAGGEPAATGSVVFRRVGQDPAQILSTDGSVLYGVAVDTPVALPPSRSTTRVPMSILPGNRCDEHARGQATAPWTLALTLRLVDDGRPVRARILVEPPLPVQQLATRALDQACAARAG